ncbi:peptide deformylase [Pseudoclavibacter chungangensis]|uniref:Peptide deformylase n=1 Tax=Pseudoclavibacter chungangensis TaxID=587635 RepID=A0A7J5BSL1_9MICO|nr:peptide deformylase [Pseudoclavibacter chungangensis]KAB1653414.1 peptide deformylase [Pseudoclavibacter chungangensis]KAB1657222.1 peptide deformylase [Pseudoclavibacter chungangensis]NYJ66344.1 peptide deformylase [Pseudoclavibacter chungangensis]
MSILPIRIYGEPVLHEVATPVGEVTDDIRSLVADMFETMDAAPGVGLAGPQVGVGKRLFVFGYTEDDGTVRRGVAIDPELWIAPAEPESLEELDEDEEAEGCLSFPGERFALRRSPRALLRARDLDGAPYELLAEGWFARILQHEYDHLDGIIYVDRLDRPDHKQAFKIMRKRSWGGPGKAWLPGADELDGVA